MSTLAGVQIHGFGQIYATRVDFSTTYVYLTSYTVIKVYICKYFSGYVLLCISIKVAV